MAHLAVSMVERGHEVIYVAERPLDEERLALGWQVTDLPGVTLHFAKSPIEAHSLAMSARGSSVHLTQGFRSNGIVEFAQKTIRLRGLRHYVVMETVDQRGWKGWLKSALYAWHLHRWKNGLEGVLAIGTDTPDWIRRLSPASLSIFPFAYFLQEPTYRPSDPAANKPFRFLFVGALVQHKRVSLLLKCLGQLSEKAFEVEIVGDGPLRDSLIGLANIVLPGRVIFSGAVPISTIPNHMANADCLILPSEHDGWGAVVSEALMAGTPVICSAACGSHGVVLASGRGGVFPTYDTSELCRLLTDAIAFGKSSEKLRDELRSWARCLSTTAGAAYLENLLQQDGARTGAHLPWNTVRHHDLKFKGEHG